MKLLLITDDYLPDSTKVGAKMIYFSSLDTNKLVLVFEILFHIDFMFSKYNNKGLRSQLIK